MQRIEICGGIATGKTSLARCLTHNDVNLLVEEKFREIPFWEKFYKAPDTYAFEKNISFLLYHADSVREAMRLNDSRLAVCDFAVFQDRAYASLSKATTEVQIIQSIYDELTKRIGLPDLIVQLKCSPQTQLRRIRRRGRGPEQSITEDYLIALNTKIGLELAELHKRHSIAVIEVDTDRTDFVNNQEAMKIASEVTSQIGNINHRAAV